MADEKKIVFSGVDNGIASQFEKFKRADSQLSDQILSNARKQNSSLKEQISYINELISAQSKLSKVSKFEERYERENRGGFEEYLKTKNPEKQASARAEYELSKKETVAENLKQDDFKEAAKTAKRTATAEEKAQKDKDKEEKNQLRKKLKTIDEEYATKKSLWDQELREDEKGVRGKIKRQQKRGEFVFDENLSPEQKEKLMYQNSKLKPDNEKNIVKTLLAAGVIAELYQTAKGVVMSSTSARDEDFLSGRLTGGLVKAGGIGAAALAGGAVGSLNTGAGQAVTAGGIATAAIVGELAQTAIDRYNSESKRRDISANSLYGTTSKGLFGGVSKFGISQAELGEIAKATATAYGTSNNLANNVKNSLAVEKAFGLDRGLVQQTGALSRITGSDSINTIASIVSSLESKGVLKNKDYAQLSELISIQNSLVSQQSKVLESPSVGANIGIMGAFKQIGGSFAGPQMGERIGQINNALSNPSNDFQKAQNFGILNKLNSGGSYFELLKMQSKGITQEGFLGETLKQLERQYGSGEAFKVATMNRTGLSPEQTEKLVGSFQADRSMFDKMSQEQYNQIVDKKKDEITARGERLVTGNEKSQAIISDAFANSPVEGVKETIKLGLNKWLVDLKSAIESGINESDPKRIKTNKTHSGQSDAIMEHYSEQKY